MSKIERYHTNGYETVLRDIHKDLPPTRWYRGFITWLKNNFLHILSVLSNLAVFTGVYVFVATMNDMVDNRITRSWTLLSTKSPGASGKIRALEFLNTPKGCIPFTNWCYWPKEESPAESVIETYKARLSCN